MPPPNRRLAAALLFICGVAFADDSVVKGLRIEHAYARPTPPGARTAAAYFTIRNTGATADRLVRAASPAARSVELHNMTMDGNVMRMRAVPGIDVPPNASVALASGGYHAMLVDLVKPLAAGDRVPLALEFEKAGRIDVVAAVEDGAAPGHGATHGK
jgi:periplasmic copper chaperone A